MLQNIQKWKFIHYGPQTQFLHHTSAPAHFKPVLDETSMLSTLHDRIVTLSNRSKFTSFNDFPTKYSQ